MLAARIVQALSFSLFFGPFLRRSLYISFRWSITSAQNLRHEPTRRSSELFHLLHSVAFPKDTRPPLLRYLSALIRHGNDAFWYFRFYKPNLRWTFLSILSSIIELNLLNLLRSHCTVRWKRKSVEWTKVEKRQKGWEMKRKVKGTLPSSQFNGKNYGMVEPSIGVLLLLSSVLIANELLLRPATVAADTLSFLFLFPILYISCATLNEQLSLHYFHLQIVQLYFYTKV